MSSLTSPSTASPTLNDDLADELVTESAAMRLPFSMSVENLVSLFIVAASSIFVLVEMHPQLLVRDSLPTGGDMGAHVWGPAFLRDELLPNFRLSGWTPDWYAGFPAYHFYMVLPSLLIVALNVGLPPFVAAGFLIVLAVLVGMADRRGMLEGKRAHFAAVLVALLAILAIGIPLRRGVQGCRGQRPGNDAHIRLGDGPACERAIPDTPATASSGHAPIHLRPLVQHLWRKRRIYDGRRVRLLDVA